MDIWAWIFDAIDDLRAHDHNRLADLLERLPERVCDNAHAQVDAMYPEALALAREAGHPWFEVFVRHWHLQSRILHRHEVAQWMGEAVDLLEFANREDTKDCPQSICVTQDLVNCYAYRDGPGYADVRLAAAEETLARIDPRWPCFTCISSEYAAALLDAERAEESLAFVDRQIGALIRAGEGPEAAMHLAEARVDALIRLGRLDEALAANRAAAESPADENQAQERALDEARILARLGRYEESAAALLPIDVVRPTHGLYLAWAEVMWRLAAGGTRPNEWTLDAQLAELQAELARHGVVRQAIQLAHWRAELALARQRPHTAARCAVDIEALIPLLHRPLDAPGTLAVLRAEIAAADTRSGPTLESAEQVREALVGDPELDLATLERATEQWPADEPIAVIRASALRTLGGIDAAIDAIADFVEAHRDAVDAFQMWLALLVDAGRADGARAVAEARLEDSALSVRSAARWHLARLERNARPSSARGHLEALVSELPRHHTRAELMLADIERESGDVEAALARIERIVARESAPGPWDWARLVVGTIAGCWEAVRHSAARLGFELNGEGPIEADGEVCRVRFEAPDGQAHEAFAVRTGPATARVVEMDRPGRDNHFGHRVVFDPTPLDEIRDDDRPDDDDVDADEPSPVWTYPCLHVLEPGGFAIYALDGVHPGAEATGRLREAVLRLGCRWQQRSDGRYILEEPGTRARRAGLYIFIAVPPDVPLAAVDKVLSAEAARHDAPMIWPAILGDLGETERAAQQRELAVSWGM